MSKPYIGQKYWTIGWRLGSMQAMEVIFHDDDIDKARSAACNMFKTEDQALAALDRVKKALRGDEADGHKLYVQGNEVKPGDMLVFRSGLAMQYVAPDFFFSHEEPSVEFRKAQVYREHQINFNEVQSIHRPTGLDAIRKIKAGSVDFEVWRAADEVKAALRNDCDTACRYLHGHKLEPGDVITTEDRAGRRHVLQYVRDDWFYDIKRGGEYETTLSYFAIVREYELKNMQVNGIYRPDGFDVIFSVIDERILPQQYIVWEKDDAREMTIADIEKELGYRIKVIKES